MYRSIVGCIVVTALAGCSTVETHTLQPELAGPYSGTQLAWRKTAQSTRSFSAAGESWLYAFDVPLCVAADTLILPYYLLRPDDGEH
jgi:uncharacterized protein YceK